MTISSTTHVDELAGHRQVASHAMPWPRSKGARDGLNGDGAADLVRVGSRAHPFSLVKNELDAEHSPRKSVASTMLNAAIESLQSSVVVMLFQDGFVCRHFTRDRSDHVDGFLQPYDDLQSMYFLTCILQERTIPQGLTDLIDCVDYDGHIVCELWNYRVKQRHYPGMVASLECPQYSDSIHRVLLRPAQPLHLGLNEGCISVPYDQQRVDTLGYDRKNCPLPNTVSNNEPTSFDSVPLGMRGLAESKTAHLKLDIDNIGVWHVDSVTGEVGKSQTTPSDESIGKPKVRARPGRIHHQLPEKRRKLKLKLPLPIRFPTSPDAAAYVKVGNGRGKKRWRRAGEKLNGNNTYVRHLVDDERKAKAFFQAANHFEQRYTAILQTNIQLLMDQPNQHRRDDMFGDLQALSTQLGPAMSPSAIAATSHADKTARSMGEWASIDLDNDSLSNEKSAQSTETQDPCTIPCVDSCASFLLNDFNF